MIELKVNGWELFKSIAAQGVDRTVVQGVKDLSTLGWSMLKEKLHEKGFMRPGLRPGGGV